MQRTSLLLLAVSLAAGPVLAQEKVQRKSGLWELKRTSTVTSGQTRVYQMCIDEASDNALSPLADGSPGEVCEVGKLQRETDRMSVDATCKIPETAVVATTHAVISGKFDSAYKVESKTTFTPALRGHQESTAVLEARWAGPCKPDQRAGDVIGPRGVKFNVADQKARNEKGARREKDATPAKVEKRRKGGYVPVPESVSPRSPRKPSVPPPARPTN